jgi:hypothetical protein
VSQSIAPRLPFAVAGPRPGAEVGVSSIGFDLSKGGH